QGYWHPPPQHSGWHNPNVAGAAPPPYPPYQPYPQSGHPAPQGGVPAPNPNEEPGKGDSRSNPPTHG
ncbi:MAG: cell division protease FtsH, partial [Mycobacterium sp.]|nr:cell division protease FtsH [Mycobacterium sp.]